MPSRHGTPPPGAGAPASAGPVRSLPSPVDTRSAKGGSFVEHLVHERGVPVTAPARAVGGVPGVGDLAGVPAELLPPKKRVVRHHPYAAALAIQDLASRGGFLAVDVEASRGDREDGLRAELLRLRIPRPALVLTKRLTITDRSRDKARLLLPDALMGPSPLLGMLTAAERRLVFGCGLPVPALDRLGRLYRMSLLRDPASRTYRLTGEWSLFVSRHDVRAGDAVEVRAFRPPAWQARLEKHGEGGLGMALLHCQNADHRWSNRERDAADGLLLVAATTSATASRSSQ